jgi:cysteine desulfurase/selenocysteine lyase
VLTLASDHHSTTLPWRTRWQVTTLDASGLEPLDPEVLRRAISPRTRALVLSHASNVTGLVQPVAALCRVAREHGLVCVVDAAQSAPHLALNVRELGCDFLAFSAHKMLGPTGVGALYGEQRALERLASSQLGGGVVERVTRRDHELGPVPARFEAGTPNIAGALGFAAATRYLDKLEWPAIREHARALTRALRDGLSSIPELRVLAAEGDALPIVSVVAPSSAVRMRDISVALSDRYGIMTRAGLLCAHVLFDGLGMPEGALRVSAYVYNTAADVESLCEALAELLSVMG